MSKQMMAPEEETNVAAEHRGSHQRGLLLIGLLKLSEALFFLLVGLGALRLLHKDVGDEVMRFAVRLGRDPEGRLVHLLMEQSRLLDSAKLREIGFFTFAYAAIKLVEGAGLMLEKTWAEYLTLTLTALALPWELFELVRRPEWIRFGLLIINLLVLWYLIWLLRRKKSAAGRQTGAEHAA